MKTLTLRGLELHLGALADTRSSFLTKEIDVEIGLVMVHDHVPLGDVSVVLLNEGLSFLLLLAVVHGCFLDL